MVDFVTALATAGQAIKLAQDLRGIDKALDAAEYKLKIADLTSALADLKNALVEAKEEAKGKEEEFKALEANFLILKETVLFEGYQYDKGPDGKPSGSPYCPVCMQKEGYMFHTTTTNKAGRPEQCPGCKAEFIAPTF
jgi:hypothetical protein